MTITRGDERVGAERLKERVESAISRDEGAGRWAAGYGAIRHSTETAARILEMATELQDRGIADKEAVFDILHAADRVASAAMWLVVHQTYARHVYLDGRELEADDFSWRKP